MRNHQVWRRAKPSDYLTYFDHVGSLVDRTGVPAITDNTMPPAPMEIVALLQPLQGKLAELRVRELLLFGSRARGDARPDSDWDFVVEFSEPPDFAQYMGLRELLEARLGGRVDLLSRSACPPRLWRAIEPELLHAA